MTPEEWRLRPTHVKIAYLQQRVDRLENTISVLLAVLCADAKEVPLHFTRS